MDLTPVNVAGPHCEMFKDVGSFRILRRTGKGPGGGTIVAELGPWDLKPWLFTNE